MSIGIQLGIQLGTQGSVEVTSAPTAIYLSRNTVPENSPGGYCIGTLTTKDAG